MTPARVALIASGSALVAAWLTAATNTRQVELLTDTISGPVQPAVQNPAELELSVEMERLQMRHRIAPVPRSVERNPFEILIPGDARVQSPDIPKSLPTLTILLVGVAEDQTPDGIIRTAILSVQGEAILAAPEEIVADRFAVEWIGPAEVGLRNLETGGIHTLELP